MMSSCVPDFDTSEKDIGFILDPVDHHGFYNGKPGEATSNLKTDNSFVPDDAFEELCWEDGQLLVVMQGSKSNSNNGIKAKSSTSNQDRVPDSPSVDLTHLNTISAPSASGGGYNDGCLNGQQADELLLWLQDSWDDGHNDRSCFLGGSDGGTRTWTDFSEPSSPNDLPHTDTSLRSSINPLRTHPELVSSENTCDQQNPSHKHQKFGVVPSIVVPPPSTSRNLQEMIADSPVAAVPSSPPPFMSSSKQIPALNSSKMDSRFAVVPNITANKHVVMSDEGLHLGSDQKLAFKMYKAARHCETNPRQAKRLLDTASGLHQQLKSVSSRRGDEESALSTHEAAVCTNLESSTRAGTSCTITERSYDLANTLSLDVSESCGPSEDGADVFLKNKIGHQTSVTWSLDASQSCTPSKDGRDVVSATGLKRKLSDIANSEHHSSQDPNSGMTNGSSTPSGTIRRNNRSSENHNQLERRRRNKIREKMKALQELIPNSNKTDKASMLDEAIAYMKLLQQKVQTMAFRSGMEISPTLLPQGMQHLQMAATLPQTSINQEHLQMTAAFPQTNINTQQLQMAALQQANMNNLTMSMNLGMMDMNGSIMSQAIYASALPQMQRLLIPGLATGASVAQSPYPAAATPFSGLLRPGVPIHAYPMMLPVIIPPPAPTILKEGTESIGINGSRYKPSNA